MGVGVIGRDISRSRAIEPESLEAKRMETLGRLARRAAHEMNNINTTILGLVDFVASRVANDPAVWEDLDEIRKKAHRGSRLARQLLAFGCRPAAHGAYVDVNTSLRGMESLLQSLVSDRVRVEIKLAPGELLIAADENHLHLILFELALRVSEAQRGYGSIQIATQLARIDADAPPGPTGVPPGAYVRVALRAVESDMRLINRNNLLRQESAESATQAHAVVSSGLSGMCGHLVLGEARGEATLYLPAVGLPAGEPPQRGDDALGETIGLS